MVKRGTRGCAIRADGTLACWPTSSSIPIEGTYESVAVSATGVYVCGLRTDDTLRCF
jgi:hypothetical protein